MGPIFIKREDNINMKKFIWGFALTIFLIIVVALLMTLPVYYLWNWLMPDLFNLPIITRSQALGINVLFNLLFGSIASSVRE